jgi:hypothetical protein
MMQSAVSFLSSSMYLFQFFLSVVAGFTLIFVILQSPFGCSLVFLILPAHLSRLHPFAGGANPRPQTDVKEIVSDVLQKTA